MVRFAASCLLVTWAGTLAPRGTSALRLDIPEGDLIVGKPVAVTWTLEPGDPFPFAIMQRSLQTNEVLRIIPVLNNPGGAASGRVLMTFDVAGQILLAPIQQLILGNDEGPNQISAGRQVAVAALDFSSSSQSNSNTASVSSSTTTSSKSSTKRTSSSTEVFTSTPTPPPNIPVTNSATTSLSTSTTIVISLGPDLSTFSFDLSTEGPLPTAKVSTATSGLSTGKKLTVAFGVLGGLIGLLLCILLLLHYQRRRANQKRMDDFSDSWDRRYRRQGQRRNSISQDVLDFQASSAVSSFSAGVRELQSETAASASASEGLSHSHSHLHSPSSARLLLPQSQPQQSLQQYSAPEGRYPLVDDATTSTASLSETQSRMPMPLPPISIPQTYITPPTPRRHGSLSLSSPRSHTLTTLTPTGTTTTATSPLTSTPTPTPTSAQTSATNLLSPLGYQQMAYTGYTPYTPTTPTQTPTTPISNPHPNPNAQQQRSRKMREVAEIQAQRKLLREEQEARLRLGAGVANASGPGAAERDSWAVILNEEPLPRYVSPAGSVRLLN